MSTSISISGECGLQLHVGDTKLLFWCLLMQAVGTACNVQRNRTQWKMNTTEEQCTFTRMEGRGEYKLMPKIQANQRFSNYAM